MLVRRIARPLFATWFVAEGLDVLRRPAAHVDRTDPVLRETSSAVGHPLVLSRARLTALVRAHGALMAAGGLMLALGRAPRTAALGLACLTVPLVVVNQPFGAVANASASAGGSDRDEQRQRWLRNLSMLGGALLAGIDTEARPGVTWRAGHARVDAARIARHTAATAAATRTARHATREAHRARRTADRLQRRQQS